MKKSMKIKAVALCMLIASATLLFGDARGAYASDEKVAGSENGAPDTYRSGTCPYGSKSNIVQIGEAACAVCTPRSSSQPYAATRIDFPGYENYLVDINNRWVSSFEEGTGMQTRESTENGNKVIRYYTCYNCGSADKTPYTDDKLIKTVYYNADGTEKKTQHSNTGADKGPGTVRVSWCEICAMQNPSAGYRCGGMSPWHFYKKYDLSLSVSPSDAGTVSGGGQYKSGEQALISATANDGYEFYRWETTDGKAYKSATSASCSISMPGSTLSLVAKFNPKEYTLTLKAGDGGSVSGSSGDITYKSTATVYATPNEGYKFTGWEVSGASLSPGGETWSFNMPAGDVTLTANFASEEAVTYDVTYTIHYMKEGAELATESYSHSYAEGTTYPGSNFGETRYYGGASYEYYKVEASGIDATDYNIGSTVVTGPITIDLWYEYVPSVTVGPTISPTPSPTPSPSPTPGPNEIRYSSNYYPVGSGGGTTTTKYTSDYMTPSLVTIDNPFAIPTGYRTFLEWNTKCDGTGTSYAVGATAYIGYYTSTLWLYAMWSDPITYTVQYAEDDIEAMPTPTLSPQETWTYDSPTAIPSKDNKIHTITYDLNPGTGSTTPAFASSLTANNTTAELAFKGWYPYRLVSGAYKLSDTSLLKVGVKKNLTTTQGDRIILFPVWGGDTVTLPNVIRNGYDFKGWSANATEKDVANIIVANNAYQPPQSMTMYAQYTPKTYDICLDKQDPDLAFNDFVKMTFDSVGPDVEVPTRYHYTFMGYFTEVNGGGDCYFDKNGYGCKVWQIYDGSVTTLYAYWVLDSQIVYYANGGAGYMPDKWLDGGGTSLILSKNLYTRHGYNFVKWNTELKGTGTDYADEATISNIPASSVITLYAQWTPVPVKVNFNAGGGECSTTSKMVYFDGTYGTLPVPTYAGYTFDNWYTEDTNELVVSSTTVTRIHEHTLKANYIPNQYTITFDWNFDFERTGVETNQGGFTNTKTVTFSEGYGTLPVPSKEGYTFLGWFLAEDSSGNGCGTQVTSSSEVNVPNNHTLYAQWENNSYTVDFDYNTDYNVKPSN